MSELDGHLVQRGVWTNLNKGSVMGQVITTDTRTGILVIAVLAVLSSLGTAHLWHLITFGYHQWRADGRKADGLYRQQQALLRTLPTPSALMADTTRLWWVWRKRTRQSIAHSLATFLLALLCACGSFVASISSSYVVSTSDLNVLVNSPHCGRVNVTMPQWESSYITSVNSVSDSYAKECYREGKTHPARCGVFAKPNIPLTKEHSPCPFSQDLCMSRNTTSTPAVTFDSGLVDINDFGMNLPSKHRVKYRRRTTCGVLPLENRTTVINANDLPPEVMRDITSQEAVPGEQLLMVHYGNRSYLTGWQNSTAIISFARTNRTYTYGLTGWTHYSDPERMDINFFEPIEQMNRTDADVALMYVTMNSISYRDPIDDLVFSVHKEFSRDSPMKYTSGTFYSADRPLSIVGCTEQHQYCASSASGDVCTKLTGLPKSLTVEDFPDATAIQLSALDLLLTSSYLTPISNSGSMNATSRLAPGGHEMHSRLPDNQWEIEVKGWMSNVWSAIQIMVADYAIGATVRDPQAEEYHIKPESEGDKALCQAMMMRKAGGFVNISVFGLVFIIALSCTILLLDTILLKFLIYLSKFRKALAPRIDRWIQDGVLQLQRRAYEAQREGTWSDLTKDVPLTEMNEKLSDLPVESLPSYKEKDDEFRLKKAETEVTFVNSPLTSPSESKEGSFKSIKGPSSSDKDLSD